MARLRPRRGAADYAPFLPGFRTRCMACSAMPFTRQAVPVPGPRGICCMHLYDFRRTRHRSEWNSNPRTRGMDPLLYHLAIQELRWMPFACRSGNRTHDTEVISLLFYQLNYAADFFKTHFYACGSRTRRPPVNCRVLPCEANAPKKLLSVSLQSTA